MALGKLILIIGLMLAGIGILLLIFPKMFSWFGQLPGDIRIVKENSRVYIPITSMILISILGTAILNLILWILSKIR
jgi:hypothetical protein